MTAKTGTMRSHTLLLIGILICGCVPPQRSRAEGEQARIERVMQSYRGAEVRHYAGVEKWSKGVDELTKCY
jgi:hypothetical protein